MSSPWDQWIKRDFEEDYPTPLPPTPVTAMLAQFMPKGSGPKPALPADYRPREISSYSPALKRTGGYSYSPSQIGEEEHGRKATAEDYKKNPFLLNILESNPSEDQEPPSPNLLNPKPKPDDKKHQQGNLDWILQPNGIRCNKKTGKCYDANGRKVK